MPSSYIDPTALHRIHSLRLLIEKAVEMAVRNTAAADLHGCPYACLAES